MESPFLFGTVTQGVPYKTRTPAMCETLQAYLRRTEGNLFNFGSSLLEGLTYFELYNGTGRNGYVLTGVFGVTADFGLNLFYGEGAEVAKNNAVSIAQSLGDQVNRLLDYFKYIILREVAVHLCADLINKLSFCDCISHMLIRLVLRSWRDCSVFFSLWHAKKATYAIFLCQHPYF